MPPKIKFTKNEIVRAAVDVVRENGIQSLTARAVAARLGSSPKVIFGSFSGMDELRQCVLEDANARYVAYIRREIAQKQYPPFKASGMAYIRFAREEKELFRLLFMRDRTNEPHDPGEEYPMLLRFIMDANGFDEAQAAMLHMEMWACVHGLAVMAATDYQPLDEALVSRVVTDVYQGACAQIRENDARRDSDGSSQNSRTV